MNHLSSPRGFPHFNSLIYPKAVPATIATAGAATYTTQQILGGMVVRDAGGAARSDTLPSAALLVEAIVGIDAGQFVDVYLLNASGGAFAITVLPGAGVTLVGAAAVNQSTSRLLRLLFTNVKKGTEAYTAYFL
jgi:hypothetical protein